MPIIGGRWVHEKKVAANEAAALAAAQAPKKQSQPKAAHSRGHESVTPAATVVEPA